MPELPEVETIVRGLSSVLIKRTLTDIKITKPKMWQGEDPKHLLGKTVTKLERIAKMVIIHFDHNLTLVIHLKMTGQLIFVASDGDRIAGGHPSSDFAATMPSKYSHIIFSFSDGSHLYFNDMRQFGYAKLVKTDEIKDHGLIATSGPDPFSPEFTSKFLLDQLHKRPKTTVKQVIMDQSVVAGLGNIYADESLFAAKINPKKPAAALTESDVNKLYKQILKVLETGIKYGGTSYKDFVHHTGVKGTMQDHLKVYHRNGLPCVVCGTKIERIVVGGRGTHFCPNCQKV